MKKTHCILLAGIISATAISCGKKGCTDPLAINYNQDAKKDDGSCELPTKDDATYTISDVTIGSIMYKKVEGSFNKDYSLSSANNYLLSGGVFVEDGSTLTIEAGTMIYAADDNTTPFLSVKQGGKINASGTANTPIVFTSVKSNPQPGDWGGIIINGKGQINTGSTGQGEGNTGIYGGSDNADNSGTLRYVRVEYAGKILGTDNELNGFAFYAVGSATTLEYLQAYKGADDGFEFFGGAANLKYAVSTGNSDDSFDWTDGWSGKGQFWVAQQSTESGDRGIEGDNSDTDNNASPISNPTLSNITLLGAEDGDSSNTGMRLREGTKAQIYNAIVTGFNAYGIRVSGNASLEYVTNGTLKVLSSAVFGNGNDWKDVDLLENDATNHQATNPSLNGYIGTLSNSNTTDPITLGSWFSSANYIGAVETGNDWTSGWTNEL